MKENAARIKILSYLISLLLFMGLVALISCGGGGSSTTEGPTTPSAVAAYVGMSRCAGCHSGLFEKFSRSGHPSILTRISGGTGPNLPYSDIPEPPPGFSWNDILYLVGGYGWKAQFVGQDGNLITGDMTQYNLETMEWVGYLVGQEASFDCGRCHTTGYSATGGVHGGSGGVRELTTIVGEWAFDGVQCEACHGPGSIHADDPRDANINVDIDPADSCERCHIRGSKTVIEAAGGFIKNYQQYTEFNNSPHRIIFDCMTCHDQHASAVYGDPTYNPETGIVKQCEECHVTAAVRVKSATMKAAGVTCTDCHMPPMVMSATGNPDTFTADVSTHIFRINLDPGAAQFSPDGTTANPYITVQYACQRCHIAGGGAQVISLESLRDYSQDYHGKIDTGAYLTSDTCKLCHPDVYETFIDTGHPNMLRMVENAEAPEYPYSSVPQPPVPYTWDQISYVIGGYSWKAQFIDKDGFIITGDTNDYTQYNLASFKWVPYHDGEVLEYDCGTCHTTGYKATGHQDGLAGITGTWEQAGVHCEACHGAGGAHVAAPSPSTINLEMPPDDQCKICHSGGLPGVIDSMLGFIKSENQADEIAASPHNILECSTCHDPHKSAIYADPVSNPDKGIWQTCEQCHPDEAANQKSATMQTSGVTCIECHMAPMVLSATFEPGKYTADSRTHLFRINTDASAEQFSPDGTQSNEYITIPYACQRCHIAGGSASEIPLASLASYAIGYHTQLNPDTYVGVDTCKGCHPDIYAPFSLTGHSHILNKITGAMAPDYPYSDVPNPPPGDSWSDIGFVIGGYGWKASFIGLDGYLKTGAQAQYVLGSGNWQEYHTGQVTPYDCGRCHTTGYDPAGNQDGVAGLIGTWEEDSVQCEACHGPGGAHVLAPSPATINVGIDPNDGCNVCHAAGTPGVIEAGDGFIRSENQADEIAQSPHSIIDCTACHDPHRSAVYSDPTYNPDKGIVTSCATCHPDEDANQKSATMEAGGVTCIECHMAQMVKSATGDLSIFTGDSRTHLFSINTDMGAQQFSGGGTESNGYITIAYACQRCHIAGGGASVIPLENLANYANNYHNPIDPSSYVGSATCNGCHPDMYEPYSLTGHAFILNDVDGNQAPEYPYSAVPNPPNGYQWLDVDWVIGGYSWKANFIGENGYILTGDAGSQTQYNLGTQTFVGYHAGELTQYDCARCHTTGYSPSGHQNGLPGIVGSWNEDNVGCEACHGHGGAHVLNPGVTTINLDGDPNDQCLNCHVRGDINKIDASGGFVSNYTQGDMLEQSPHGGILECTSCHDPHRSSQYEDPVHNPDKGLVTSCETCHSDETAFQKSTSMVNAGLACVDCHMAPMVMSASGDISKFTADLSSHIFEINTDPNALQFTPDGTGSNPYITIAYACRRCHIAGGGATDISVNGLATYAQNYHEPIDPNAFVNSAACSSCHKAIYDTHSLSGHAYILNAVTGGQAPEYPYSEVPDPPTGYTWDDVSYVIGGYGWKTRFINTTGYIITGNPGDMTQYNLQSMEWVEYHAGEILPYYCGACHSTGYSSAGHQDGLAGITGTWSQPGVHCEACHGAGGEHIMNPSPLTINKNGDPNDACQACHSRDASDVIEAMDGFVLSHQQWEEFAKSPHGDDLDCSTCHDQHASVLYSDPVHNPDQGIIMTCEQCHPDEAAHQKSLSMQIWGVSCLDCHMPYLVKTVEGNLSLFSGDMRVHFFQINTDEAAEQFNPGGTEANPYVTISYACFQCHNDDGVAIPLALSSAAAYAVGYHED